MFPTVCFIAPDGRSFLHMYTTTKEKAEQIAKEMNELNDGNKYYVDAQEMFDTKWT